MKPNRLAKELMKNSGVSPCDAARLVPETMEALGDRCSGMGHAELMVLLRRVLQGLRKQDRIIPRNWQRRRQALRRAAGFARGSRQPDVCRHTFASYHAARYRDLPALQMEMGHRDLTLLRTRYVSPIGQKESRQFFSSAP